MPPTRLVSDTLGVVAICLIAIFILLGFFCIGYSLYLRTLIHGQDLVQLSYFSGPWIVRITFIVLAMWWGVGELTRLSLLRRKGRFLGDLTLQWQHNVCKSYIVSNLGFAEPCLFLILVFLLQASLQWPGMLSWKWNKKTVGFVLYCLPIFVLQLTIILVGPEYKEKYSLKFPSYFIQAASPPKTVDGVTICTYPLLSTILIGLFATVLTAYLFCLGRRILHLVINKGLRKRVYALTVSISSLFPLRVILLGLSVLADPENTMFDAVSFLALLSFLCSMGMSICILVYLPIADCLSLRHLHIDMEAGMGEYNDSCSLTVNQSTANSSRRNSAASAGQGSVSFRTMENNNNERVSECLGAGLWY